MTIHTDNENLRLLYAMNSQPYEPRGYWTTSRSFQLDEKIPAPQFILDNKMTSVKPEFKLDGQFKQIGGTGGIRTPNGS